MPSLSELTFSPDETRCSLEGLCGDSCFGVTIKFRKKAAPIVTVGKLQFIHDHTAVKAKPLVACSLRTCRWPSIIRGRNQDMAGFKDAAPSLFLASCMLVLMTNGISNGQSVSRIKALYTSPTIQFLPAFVARDPPIIDQKLYDRVQEKLKNESDHVQNSFAHRTEYLLSRLVVCDFAAITIWERRQSPESIATTPALRTYAAGKPLVARPCSIRRNLRMNARKVRVMGACTRCGYTIHWALLIGKRQPQCPSYLLQ